MIQALRTLFILSLFLNNLLFYGQSPDTTKEFKVIEIPAVFPGGPKNMYKVISDNIKYPKSALKDEIGGKAVVQFYIDTSGNAIDIKIIQSVREDIDQETVRVIGLLNGWTPGTQNGKKVIVKYTIPITFTPPERKHKKKHAEI